MKTLINRLSLRIARSPIGLGVGALLLTTTARAQPITSPFAAPASDRAVATAAAQVAGYFATASTQSDTVEIRDVRQSLVRSIPRSRFATAAPWMNLDTSNDGPTSLAFTDSGRLLYIALSDAAPATDSQPSDAILRYDVDADILTVFLRVELASTDEPLRHAALLHFKSRLYVGLESGILAIYNAPSSTGAGTLAFAVASPNGQPLTGLSIDRDTSTLHASWGDSIYRASAISTPTTFTLTGSIPSIRALAYSTHFGGNLNPGLYVLTAPAAPASGAIKYLFPGMASGALSFLPSDYATLPGDHHDLAPTSDGAMLLASDSTGATLLRDQSDTRLTFESWLTDEIAQVVTMSRSLTRPDGYVIDGDTDIGVARFHPATPDAAAWAVFLLLTADSVLGDTNAQAEIRTILARHAGSLSGADPVRSADGIFKHWIDPLTGNTKSGWADEYATMSTMKIALAAVRASAYYPSDASIKESARLITCGITNWDSYFQAGTDAMYLKALAGGGPDPFSAAGAYHEGILFTALAAAYGGIPADFVYSRWLNRALWPNAQYVPGRTVTGNQWGVHQSAFLSNYANLLLPEYRASADWRLNMRNVRINHAAWTDDNAPKYNTVFSAGTTPTGYNADSLSNHPSDITTFTSLMALSADGTTPDAVGAYNAYRRGARQVFTSGASILYRRSNTSSIYEPNSCGMPDVALGALGLAELVQPGFIDAVLAAPMPPCPICIADVDDGSATGHADGGTTIDDLLYYLSLFNAGDLRADVDNGSGQAFPDGGVTIDDLLFYLTRFNLGC
ncbi:MAG: hypothetical protein IPK69_12740 [Phycisphaerales bacterium]|nr:MAG: hypothetical protein IPK69_12740 [Phycisphaerales bacterium]